MYLEKFETEETKNYRRTKKKLKLLEKNERKDQNLYNSIIGKDSKSHNDRFVYVVPNDRFLSHTISKPDFRIFGKHMRFYQQVESHRIYSVSSA